MYVVKKGRENYWKHSHRKKNWRSTHCCVREKKWFSSTMIFCGLVISFSSLVTRIFKYSSQNFVQIVGMKFFKGSTYLIEYFESFNSQKLRFPSSAVLTVGITVTYLLIYECIIFPHKTQMKLELPSYQIQGYLLY